MIGAVLDYVIPAVPSEAAKSSLGVFLNQSHPAVIQITALRPPSVKNNS
jgi:hypothetical protein